MKTVPNAALASNAFFTRTPPSLACRNSTMKQCYFTVMAQTGRRSLFVALWRPAMKLFCAPGSSSLLPHIVLLEAGLPFTAIPIDEHTKVIEGGGDYRSVNPLGYVPALLLDDGTLLTEGPAIVQYIADQ